MDLDEDEDPEEPEAPAEDDNDAMDGDNANISDLATTMSRLVVVALVTRVSFA
jgi:hypothetical protein